MPERIGEVSRKVIEFSFYALFFFTPLLFTKINSELFELPKMYFVWALTIIIVISWAIRSIATNRLIFNRTPLDLPLLLFLLSQLVSYFFSIDPHISFWGDYSRLNGGLLSLISYCFLYWAFVSNMSSRSSLITIHYLLITGFLVSLWGIPAHFGRDPTCLVFYYDNKISITKNLADNFNNNCWSATFVPSERIFSTLGQPNWLASWLVGIMPLAWGMLVRKRRDTKDGIRKIIPFAYLLSLITFLLLALFYTKSDSGFLGLAVASVVFLGLLTYQRIIRSAHILFTILILVIISSVIFTSRLTPIKTCLSILTNHQSQVANHEITPSWEIRCIIWKGALRIWQKHLIFGTGPETFAFSYYKEKPPEQNLTSEWNFVYNKAHNEYLNYLANTGLVGLGTYLVLIITFVTWIISKQIPIRSIRNLMLALTAGYASILATNFFGFSVVPTQLLFFLYPALAFTLTQPLPTSKPTSHLPSLSLTFKIPALLLALILIINFKLLILNYFLADYHYAKSQEEKNRGEYQKALKSIRNALKLRGSEPLYYDEASSILSSLAILATTPDVASEISEIAKDTSDAAIAASPENITFWKNRGNVFIKLGTVWEKYLNDARLAFEKASHLAPNDAKITYDLALVYWQQNDFEKSKEQVKKALFLRPNYDDAKKLLEELSKSP